LYGIQISWLLVCHTILDVTRSRPRGPSPDRGRATRYRIIEQTARLCTERHGAEVSVAEIAAAARVFPNQVTYYFGSKDSLLVHAAFLALLHDAETVEPAGYQAADSAAFRREIAQAVLSLPSLPVVASALAMAIARPDLAPVVHKHLRLLFRQSERYLRRVTRERGWTLRRTPAAEARTFWSAALGAVLLARAGAASTTAEFDLAGTLTIGGTRVEGSTP
jgi:AcrR family transcriptional regulator